MPLWDELTGRYLTEAGEYITRDSIFLLLEQSITFTGATALEATLAGTTERAIYIQMREVIKREYIRQYILGKGGLASMTYRDWGSLGGMLRNQYGYIRNFAADVVKGNLSEAQITARVNMFSNASREAYNRAKARVVKSLMYDEVAWNLMPGANHCDTCVERSLIGYVPIGPRGGFPTRSSGESFPGDGSTDCLTNDRCFLSYRNSKTNEEYYL